MKCFKLLLYYLLLVLALGCTSLKEPVDKKNGAAELDVQQLDQSFAKAETSERLEILDDLKESVDPNASIILIRAMFNSKKRVRQKALEVFELNRQVILKNLNINYYDHLDSLFRQYPLIILDQMGYKQQYLDFIAELENKGRRVQFYKKNPLRFLLKSKELYKIMEKLMESEYKEIVQFWAAWIAGEMGLDSEVSYLMAAVRSPGSHRQVYNVKCSALWALAKMKRREWTLLFADLIRDSNPYLQELTAISAGKIYESKFLPLFLDLLYSEKDFITPQLKMAMIWTLTIMRDRNLVPFAKSVTYRDDVHWIRILRIWSLYILGLDKAPEILVQSLSDSNLYVREVALKVVQNMDDPSIASKLYPLLKDKSTHIKITTLKLLARWEIKEATLEILPLLQDKKNDVVDQTIEALGEIASKKAAQPLINVIRQGGFTMNQKALAVEALIEIEDPIAFEPILGFYRANLKSKKSKAMIKEDFPDLSLVITSLANKNKLLKLLKSPSDGIKIEAIRSIPYFKKDFEDYDFIIPLLKGSSTEVAVAIIRLIGDLKYQKALKFLKSLIKLKRFQSELRLEAIRSLGKLKNRKGRRLLTDLIDALDQKSKLAAIEALGYLADRKGASALKDAYIHSRSRKEKILIILSLVLLDKINSKDLKNLMDLIQDPSNELKNFIEEYLDRMPIKMKTKLIRSILTQLGPIYEKQIKGFFNESEGES
ncbi:MAG: hypothetical protein IEMM0008_0047 [bacterium]|nr:MAG: hypothetical protein IEMM0008_0047 [bacterium]